MELISVIILLVAALAAVYQWWKTSRPKNFPPGPRGLPFLGNILSLGRKRHLTFLKWKETYGDVFSIYDGRKAIVILSDFYIVRRVFGDDAASGRRTESAVRVDATTLGPNSGIVFSQGDLWKTHRRFALSTLRDLGMGKNWLEDTIIAQVEELCQNLRAVQGVPVNPSTQVTISVSNVICALIFGRRFELTDPRLTRLTGMMTEHFKSYGRVESLAPALPFLMWFPNAFRDITYGLRRNITAIKTFLKEQVQEHDADTSRQTNTPDYVYAYQKEQATATNETFTEEQLLSSLFDLFVAGTETTATTILWSFVFMLENPNIMKNVQAEIDNTAGRERLLTNAERVLLPYTEAVILEVQRCASLAPFALPHRTLEAMTIDGYFIPKGTTLVANIFAIHRDSRLWKNPLKFDPSRFLDESGKLTRPDGFAPFSIGKRVCIGEALAKMELFLYFANLLRCFTLELPVGRTVSRDDYTPGVTLCPTPFDMIFVPRTSS